MGDWITTCEQAWGSEGLRSVLEAFGGPTHGERPSPSGLTREASTLATELPRRIVQALDGEVDRDQAMLFARRFQAVLGLLEREEAWAQAFRVGLALRCEQILQEAPPRALRIRACADFYYSHTAVRHHGADPGAPSPGELAAQAPLRPVAQGVHHALVEGMTRLGPVHLDILRVAPEVPLRCVDCRGGGEFSQSVASLAPAGISGGYFLYSEADIREPSQRGDPVGLLVSEARVLNPPVFRRSALIQDASGFRIEVLGMEGVVLQPEGLTVLAHNHSGALPAAFNRAYGERSPAHEGPSIAVVGRQVVARGRGSLPIPLAGFVLALPEGVRLSQQLHYELPGSPSAAMAGGPSLEAPIQPRSEDFAGSAPPVTFSRDETFDQNLLPRMAAGLDDGGQLWLVAVDGRNFQRAPGLRLRDTGDLLHHMGCTRTMNLDGGSSKRMVVQGKLVDLSSTEVVRGGSTSTRQRPVHSAILIGELSPR